MEPTTQAVPGYFVWEAPGQALVIHLHLDVVERLGADIMRGFGALPKRGAEVGGLLLGTIENGDVTIVRIEDFEDVPCRYKRGPSYLFTEDTRVEFDEACARWQPAEARPVYAVGYYRSHTREGPAMTAEDVELLDQYFPFPAHVALVVKPFASKPSLAGFLVRQDGVFPATSPVEFPFRRRELSPEADEGPPANRRYHREERPEEPRPALVETESPEPVHMERPMFGNFIDKPPRARRGLPGWIWIPLAFVFLILGFLLGYQGALTRTPNTDGVFSLALSVTRTGDNLTVGWNRDAPAVRAAQKGILEIEDGGYSKPVELDTAQLQGGSLIYRNSSNRVRFRLIISLNPRSNVTETLEWQQ